MRNLLGLVAAITILSSSALGAELHKIDELLAHDEVYPLPYVEEGQSATAATLDIHEILHVKSFYYVVAHGQDNAMNKNRSSNVVLHLIGQHSPSTEVTGGQITFIHPGKKLAEPRYIKARKLIAMEYPVSQLDFVDNLLRNTSPVHMQFRYYSNGHIHADIHTDLIPIK